jgi:hypothetical protein
VFVDADSQAGLHVVDLTDELGGFGEHGWRVEQGARTVRGGVMLGVCIGAGSPVGDEGFDAVPAGVAAAGLGLADPGITVADSDGSFLADGVGELGEAAVFFVMMKSRLMAHPLRKCAFHPSHRGLGSPCGSSRAAVRGCGIDVFTQVPAARTARSLDVSEAESLVGVCFVDGDADVGVVVVDTDLGEVTRVVSMVMLCPTNGARVGAR